MFCDLIGSTALSARLNPEDFAKVIRTYQICVDATIDKFDGFIARYVGDGVLISWLARSPRKMPNGRCGPASRSLEGGQCGARSGEPLQVHIGIATGLVVIGEAIGSGNSRQQTAVGETPIWLLACRALPDQSGGDRRGDQRQIGGLFECRDLGTVELKGLPAAVPSWQVLFENRALGQFEAFARVRPRWSIGTKK